MAQRIADLKIRAKSAGVPHIYVNDNFGRWRSDFKAQVGHCIDDGTLGRPIVELLRPDEDDYFVLKPKHSGFFSTTLNTHARSAPDSAERLCAFQYRGRKSLRSPPDADHP